MQQQTSRRQRTIKARRQRTIKAIREWGPLAISIARALLDLP